MKMIAVKAIKYAGKSVAAGETFIARGRRDARLLSAIGSADRYIEPAKVAAVFKPVRAPKKTDSPAEFEIVSEPEVVADENEELQPRPKRKYTRRDLTAE